MKIALTFDFCEQPNEISGYDAEVVNILRQHDVRATLFAGGKWISTHAEQAQQLLSDPLFEVGNHTWSHRNLRIIPEDDVASEIERAQASYEGQVESFAKRGCVGRDGGRTIAPLRMSLFRFPFGACNASSLDKVGMHGLIPIQWDVSSGDPAPHVSAEAIAAAVINRVRPGSIVLFHANGRGWRTAAALRNIVPTLRRRGYEFVTVTELISFPGAVIERHTDCFDGRKGDTNRYDDLAKRLERSYSKFNAEYQRASRRE